MSRRLPNNKNANNKKKGQKKKKEESLGSFAERSTLWNFIAKGKDTEWTVRNPPPVKTAEDLNRENIKKLFYKSGAEHSIVKEKNEGKVYIDLCTPPSREEESSDNDASLEMTEYEEEKNGSDENSNEKSEESNSMATQSSGKEGVENIMMDDSNHVHLLKDHPKVDSKDTLLNNLVTLLNKPLEQSDPDYSIWKWCISEHCIEEKYSATDAMEEDVPFLTHLSIPMEPLCNLHVNKQEISFTISVQNEEKKEEEKRDSTRDDDLESREKNSQEYRLFQSQEIQSHEENPFQLEPFQSQEDLFQMDIRNEPPQGDLQHLNSQHDDDNAPVSQNHFELNLDDFGTNRCIVCRQELGPNNPRQYCGKIYCINPFI